MNNAQLDQRVGKTLAGKFSWLSHQKAEKTAMIDAMVGFAPTVSPKLMVAFTAAPRVAASTCTRKSFARTIWKLSPRLT